MTELTDFEHYLRATKKLADRSVSTYLFRVKLFLRDYGEFTDEALIEWKENQIDSLKSANYINQGLIAFKIYKQYKKLDLQIPKSVPSQKKQFRRSEETKDTKEPPNKSKLNIKLDKGAKLPTRAHATDAGLDLYAMEDQIISAKESAEFDTGVHIELPAGTVGFLKSKSGLNVKHGITGEGVIDVGYTGSIRVKLYNHSGTDYHVKAGDKISQLVILPILAPSLELVEELGESERGENGFGSSGR